MEITFKLYGYLPSQLPAYDPKEGRVIEVEKHTRIEDVISILPLDPSECIAISAEGVVLPKSSCVEGSTLIRLFPIAAGG
jgi:hypothetical protein